MPRKIERKVAAVSAAVAVMGTAGMLATAAPASAQVYRHTNWAYTTDSGGAGGRSRIELYADRAVGGNPKTQRDIKLVVLDRDNNDHKVAYASVWAGNKKVVDAWDTATTAGDNYWNHKGSGYSFEWKPRYPQHVKIRARTCLVDYYGQTSNAHYCSWTTSIIT